MYLDKYDLAAILLATDLQHMELDGELCKDYPTPEQLTVALVPAERIVEAVKTRRDRERDEWSPGPDGYWYVLAASVYEARLWAMAQGHPHQSVRYLADINDLRGIRISAKRLVKMDYWKRNIDYDADFMAALDACVEGGMRSDE
jgi:hypothetical protein